MGLRVRPTLNFRVRVVTLILLAVSLCLSTACTRSSQSNANSPQVDLFRPPTAVPTPSPIILPSPTTQILAQTQSTPLETSSCTNSLSFVSDETIPDGTKVMAGSTMDKRWKIKNNGTCNWDDKYTIRLIAGSEMGTKKEQALEPVRSQSEAVIRIIFTAPSDPSTHRSAWQAYDPKGQPFGDPFYIEIIVESGHTVTSTPH
jgi:hypothetical protein